MTVRRFLRSLLPCGLAICASGFLVGSLRADTGWLSIRQEISDPPVAGNPGTDPVVGTGGTPGPTLPFLLGVEYRCPWPDARQRLFVTVADSGEITDATGLPSPQTVRVEVPLRQLQWLHPVKACRERAGVEGARGADGVRYYRLHARATAFATLTCTGPDDRTAMTMTTVPLDVWLGCPAEESPVPGDVGLNSAQSPDSAAGN
jgi:hypothetical protein